MVTRTLSSRKRPPTNGLHNQANGTKNFKTKQDWPLDLGEAYQRDRGPYTLHNAITLLAEEPLELFNGWLVWQAMTDAEERRIAATIQVILDIAARALGFGQAYPDQLECVMVNQDLLKPDVCVISKERYEQQVEPEAPGSEHLVLKGSPELVVEIRSPSNRRTQERKKRKSYFESGAEVIWDVDYQKRKIWVYEVGTPDKGQEFTEQDEISCKPLLAGWKRKVEDFFSKDLSAEEIVGQVAGQWRAESKAEGEIEALRNILIIQAEARFGKELPENLEERLNHCKLEKLIELATLVATTSSLADWLKALPD